MLRSKSFRIWVKKIPFALRIYDVWVLIIIGWLKKLISHFKYNMALLFGADFNTQARLLPLNPLKMLLWFNPQEINFCVKKDSMGFRQAIPLLIEGDWDQDGSDFIEIERAVVAQTIQQLFVEKKFYRDTVQYGIMKKAIESNHPNPNELGAYRCKSVSDIDNYFFILNKAYEKIRTDGYKTQAELVQEGSNSIKELNDEIKIYIDRYGKLILGFGGTHRLLIAKLLSLPLIPGLVVGIHNDWAKACHQQYRNKSLEANIIEAIKSRWKFVKLSGL